MIDPLAAAVSSLAAHQLSGLPCACAAGLASSVGPCVAPRYLALASLIDGRKGYSTIAAFSGGLVLAFAVLGIAADLFLALVNNAAAIDAMYCGVLVLLGAVTLFRTPHACSTEHTAMHGPHSSRAFSLGAASALVVSPCCTPAIIALASFHPIGSAPLLSGAYLATFGLGHIAPILALGIGGSFVAQRVAQLAATAAPAVVSGTLAIGLGCYYGLLV